MNTVSYCIGVLAAQTMINELRIKSVDDYVEFISGVKDRYESNISMTPDEINKMLGEYFAGLQEKERRDNEEYLVNNGNLDNVTVTESGLQYEILEKGEGTEHPTPSDNVTVHYEGTFIDGTVFDSSYRRGEPTTFRLDQVILGWTEGLQRMSPGDKFKLTIPYNLAYGEAGANTIPPFSTLVFVVELISIEKNSEE